MFSSEKDLMKTIFIMILYSTKVIENHIPLMGRGVKGGEGGGRTTATFGLPPHPPPPAPYPREGV